MIIFMLLPDDLQIDYQFTFNLSKHEDRHIRQINFFNVPTKSDVDTDFDIFCSKDTKIKISAKTSEYSSIVDIFLDGWNLSVLLHHLSTTIKQMFPPTEG